MRTVALALCCLMLLTPLAGCLGSINSGDNIFDEPEPLRINHIQVLGTHNSYHIEPFGPTIRAYDYTHEPLDVQAEDFAVRQFELDVWWDPRGQLYVYHNQYDFRTNCATFEDCLNTLLTWSNENPNHVPLMIWVEPKEWVRSSTDDTVVLELQDMLEKIETEIEQWWPREKIITPDDVKGDAASLREAVTTNGWPLLDDSRGKAMFILLAESEVREAYVDAHPGLNGSLMFTMNDEASETAAFYSETDPIGMGSEITRLVEEGYIVRSRADNAEDGEADNNDTARRDAAFAVGAHSISTDYPAKVDGIEYWVQVPNGPIACNPVTAPPSCNPDLIEPTD